MSPSILYRKTREWLGGKFGKDLRWKYFRSCRIKIRSNVFHPKFHFHIEPKKYKKKFLSISFTSKVSSLWLILSTKSIKSARKINFFIQKIIFTLAIPSEIFSIFMDPGHNSGELMVILLGELLNNSLELGLSVDINNTKAKMLIIFE